MDLQLTGSRVLVTGGTRGIGRALVEGLLDEGAVVRFCARDSEEVAATQDALRARGTLSGAVADVGDGDALADWVQQSAQTYGGLDVIVANVSALAIPDTEENWQASLNVDLMHTVRLVRAAMPHLQRSDNPSIIAISSVPGRESDFASGPYGTAKTAIVGYIHGLAMQLAGQGIRANTVSPGDTYFEGGVWASIETGNPDLFSTAVELNPTGHLGTPEDVAGPVVFLASVRARRISGTNLVVDGALTRGIQLQCPELERECRPDLLTAVGASCLSSAQLSHCPSHQPTDLMGCPVAVDFGHGQVPGRSSRPRRRSSWEPLASRGWCRRPAFARRRLVGVAAERPGLDPRPVAGTGCGEGGADRRGRAPTGRCRHRRDHS